jgi:hypothetical protein
MDMNIVKNMDLKSKRICFSDDTKDFDGNSKHVAVFGKLVLDYFNGKIATSTCVLDVANKNEAYVDYFIGELKNIEACLEELREDELFDSINNEYADKETKTNTVRNHHKDLYCGCCSKTIGLYRQNCKKCVDVQYCSSECVRIHSETHNKDCEWNNPLLSAAVIKKNKKGIGMIRCGSRIVSHRLFVEHLPFVKKLLHLVFCAKETFDIKEHPTDDKINYLFGISVGL